MRSPRWTLLALPLATALAACSDDEPATTPNAACEISEKVRIATPPAGWTADPNAKYNLHAFGDLVLYTFDDVDDPARLYHRLDRCTGESAPFPSLTPGLQSPYVVDTAIGRVLYASTPGGASVVVDRLDVPGDDTPQKIADLPGPGWITLNLCNALAELPYACFWRGGGFYTHNGDPDAPALAVSGATHSVATYPDAILSAENSGDLRRSDPLTGASELLLTGAQYLEIVEPGPYLVANGGFPLLDPAATANDALVLWQPADESRLYLRRLADGVDIPLAVDPALATSIPSGAFISPLGGGGTLLFADHELDRILAAVDTDTGATLTVPEHTDYDIDLDNAISLTLPAPGTLVQAIWEPQTNALHAWYRGPGPSPELYAYNGDSVDYFEPDPDDPSTTSLWRVDLASGERRQLAPRVSSPWSVQGSTVLLRFNADPTDRDDNTRRQDLEYLDLTTGRYTPIAGLASAYAVIPDQGVLYLDADSETPGIWAAPLP